MDRHLQGKVGLITGGGSGVGLAIAQRCARRGMAVGLLGRRADRLDHAVALIAAEGGSALALPANVADWDAVRAAVERLVGHFGRLDLLVNNAGISGRGTVEETSTATWRETIEVNLVGAFHCAKAAIPHLRASGGGWIIGIASGAAKRGYAGLSAYSASKAGLTLFNESLALELEPYGIKVSTIILGSVLTDFGTRSREQKLASRAAGEKFMEPEDVADAVDYLLGQSARAWTQELNLWPR
ncbi:MAG: SDR family oxidoreductase [Chloroflexota bacterium]|nr:SDR family oxidoreductase [Dehalococcoidia bacterium]MDW8254766.1 SDR family oxidoreductase [Chloroflexota bacterium]